jgi:hypothetical protein
MASLTSVTHVGGHPIVHRWIRGGYQTVSALSWAGDQLYNDDGGVFEFGFSRPCPLCRSTEQRLVPLETVPLAYRGETAA